MAAPALPIKIALPGKRDWAFACIRPLCIAGGFAYPAELMRV
jgi:hypothetical protein